MTKEEAIEQLEPLAGYFDKHVPAMGGDAIRLAISALRAQQAKLDRSRWEGCKTCKGGRYRRGEYCPGCGRPLTEEAWAETKRRINGGTTDDA